MDPAQTAHQTPRREKKGIVGGVVLVVLGLLFLADNLLPDVRFSDYWPLILVAVGIGLLFQSRSRSEQ